MMAAIAAKAQFPAGSVLIIERNEELGRKLLATGNGRCNFTNLQATAEDYGEAAPFVASVFQQMPPARLCQLFASFGIVSREEAEGRVYPYSGQGSAVCSQLKRQLQQRQVNVRCGVSAVQVEAEESAFLLQLSDGGIVRSSNLILASGGKAGGQYGCQGDGYRFLRSLQHVVNKPHPALIALQCRVPAQSGAEPWPSEWKGVRAQAGVSLWRFPADAGEFDKGISFGQAQLVAEDKGEVQLTATGLSGICIFNLSRYVIYSVPLAEGRREQYLVALDFLPQHSQEQADALLLAQAEALREEPAEVLLLSIVHQRLIAGILRQVNIAPDERLEGVGEKRLLLLSRLLKRWCALVEGTKGWNDAQVTAGGADCVQFNPQTMQSRLIPGLYLCGELFDVDGRCGGYNLQWAFASGYAAGCSAGQQAAEASGNTKKNSTNEENAEANNKKEEDRRKSGRKEEMTRCSASKK